MESVSADTVYFSCNKDDPRQTQLCSVKLDGSGFRKVTSEEGTHEVKFAHKSMAAMRTISPPLRTPPWLSICTEEASCRKVWESRAVAEYYPA